MSTVIRPRPASTDRHRGTDFGDIDALAGRIATALGVTPEEARGRLAEECASLGVNVRRDLARRNIQPHVWSDGLIRFYESTDAFFYELCAWNSTTEKRRQRSWIVEHLGHRGTRPLSILTYGDGLGFDGVEFTLAGHTVTCFEVSTRYRAFAQALARDHGITIEWLENEEDLHGRRFDVIVCLDVLEHVPDPPRLVNQLAQLLAPDGELIVHAPFWLVDRGTTTHLATNRTYSGDISRLYTPAGLVPVDARWMWNPIVLARRQAGRARTPARVVRAGLLLRLARFNPLPFTLTLRALLGRDLGRRLRESRMSSSRTAGGHP